MRSCFNRRDQSLFGRRQLYGRRTCAWTGDYTATIDAARLLGNQASTTAIDAYGEARFVDNKTNNSLFVPFKSKSEWDAVLTSSNFAAVPAAVPQSSAVPAGAACAFPDPASATIQIPYYARPLTSNIPWPAAQVSPSFTCTVKGLCGNGSPSCGADQTWTQTTAITFSTGSPDAQTSFVPWNVNVIYSANAPAAKHEPVDGVCGVGQYNCTDLCDKEGTCAESSAISESNSGETFYWQCTGLNGGAASGQCSDTNGSCGGAQFSCVTGTPTSENDFSGTSTWTCFGINGGANDNCNICDAGYVRINGICLQPVNGQCGTGDGACNAGTPAGNSSDGTYDYWYCAGTNTGSNSPQCSYAIPKSGQCGSSDWGCSVGSAVSGSSDWNNDYWYCSGVNGGSTSGQCSFPRSHDGQCGGGDWSCTIGSAYSGWSDSSNDYWICSGVNGGNSSPQCSYARAQNGQCGGGDWQCNVGGVINQASNNGTDTWNCEGVNGGNASAQCSYAPTVNGTCNYAQNWEITGFTTCCGANSPHMTTAQWSYMNTYDPAQPCASGTMTNFANNSIYPDTSCTWSGKNQTCNNVDCVAGQPEYIHYTWTCAGANGGTSTSCSTGTYYNTSSQCVSY